MDSPSGDAAFLSGQEIVNSERTLVYLSNGFGPPSMTVNGGCSCSRIRELIECDSLPYSTPASDPAPWYDASIPESGDLAGFLPVEFSGLGSTYTRTPTDKVTGGAVIGRLRPGPRTLTWRGFLFGRSDCAVRYGLSWMTANLKGSNCNCGGEDLDLLVCCPELNPAPSGISPPVSGICQSAQRPDFCPPFTQPDAFRQLKNVGLLAGPTILSQRKIGCNISCGNEACGGETTIVEIEFSLLAGNPFLYGCPVCLCVDEPFPVFTEEDCLTAWQKVSDPNNPTGPCVPAVCPEPTDCTLTDTVCDPVELPNIPPFVDNCFCDPLFPVQFCCNVPADSFGQFFEGAPVIEITNPTAMPMRSTTIRFFENLQGRECCDVAEDPCLNCDSLQIRYIPPESTMTIDGTTRTVTVLCKGSNEPVRAEHLTVTPFSWPLLECIDFCICIETDSLSFNPEGEDLVLAPTVTVLITPREN